MPNFELTFELTLGPVTFDTFDQATSTVSTMSSSSNPRNRKERRAAAKTTSPGDVPMAQPDRSGPKHKTLLDLAAERNAEHFGSPSNGSPISPKVVMKTINPDGTFAKDTSEDGPLDDPIGPFGNAVFYSISLTMLHVMLDVLVHNQYAESINWNTISWRMAQTFPMLLTMVYMLHSRAGTWWAQSVFLVTSMAAGIYLIYSSNEEKYMAVMKRAPPVGTLWVWSVIELRLEVALLGLAVVGGYFWWGEYTIF